MTVDMIVNPLSSKGTKQKTTPPRVKSATGISDQSPIAKGNSNTSFINSGHENSNSNSNSDNEEGSKKPSTDDVLTEEDTDDEEQDKIFLGLAHEGNDVPNLLNGDVHNSKNNVNLEQYEYNAYSAAHLDKIYHPTSSIFEDNKKDCNNHHQPGFFSGNEGPASFLAPRFSTTEDSTFLQDSSTIYERTSFSRRPSQLQHEMSSMNALGPPSHVLKARRLSKNIISSSSSTPITPVKSLSTNSISIKDKRKPSIVNNYSKEFSDSNNSAVSPRFMALRKLSEVTTLPSHSISYSAVPPVPQIPASYHNIAADDHTNTSSETASKFMTTNDNENRILARIDDIIETQLQFHLGQVIWRASESHLEARKFWEEQKKEMFGFAATLVDRMEVQEDMTRRMTLDSLNIETTTDEKKETSLETLKKELAICKSNVEKQIIEIEHLKTKKTELEKQHEIDVISMSKQWEDKDATLKRLRELELKQSNAKKPKNVQIANLEAENTQLKLQMKKTDKVNRQLVEEASDLKLDITSRDQEIKLMKQQISELKSASYSKRKASTSTAGASDKHNGINSENWADIMESEDEAKKSADEWASKYRELQSSYFDVCLQLEKLKKNGAPSEDEKKLFDLGQTIMAKNEEIRHLKQAENVNRIQMDYMQKELDKYQRSTSPLTDAEEKTKQKAIRANKRKSQHRKSTPPTLNMEKESPTQEISPKLKENKHAAVVNINRPTTPQKKHVEEPQPEKKDISPQPNEVKEHATASSSNSDYVTENGYLTFTTEINGVLSNYSIKLPTGYCQSSKTKQTKINKTNSTNIPRNIAQDAQESKEKKKKLNPNAAVWKA